MDIADMQRLIGPELFQGATKGVKDIPRPSRIWSPVPMAGAWMRDCLK